MRRLMTLFVLLGSLSAQRFEAPRFEPFVVELRAHVERQQREMGVPGIWIALLEVDPDTGKEHLWADVVGDDNGKGVLATHRVASISKLFTDVAAMVLVERGKLELDADVRKWLPDFAPANPFGKPITLRQLMRHHSGLVRESPVGHYFDASGPTLAETVASLNDTALVAEPGASFKYSNPAIGVVGRLIEVATGKPFEAAMRELLLDPLQLRDSDFAARDDLVERQARGIMWTYDGRRIPTPDFRFGYVPAAEIRSTVVDLVRFARSWFPSAKRRVLQPQTQRSMWPIDESRFGLGFFLGRRHGHLRVAHGGAVYGFASTLTALPDEGLAVAVVCTMDFANEVADDIAYRALDLALANRRGEQLPPPQYPSKVGVRAARAVAGRWLCGEYWVDLKERGGELYYDPNIGVRTRMRVQKDGLLIADDPLSIGANRSLRHLPNGNLYDDNGKVEYVRDTAVPGPPPEHLRDYLGDYGWDHNVLFVYEDKGQLGVLIEWVVRDLVEKVGEDLYRFPPGMYTGDQLRFERDDRGEVVAAIVGGARFPRRPGPTGDTFRIQAVRPVAELVAASKQWQPPARLTSEGSREFELVDLRTLDDTLQFDIRYATANNFLGAPVYERPAARLQRPAAAALLRAHKELNKRGLGLKIFDGYRPWSVTKVFWEATPRHQKLFVADPMRGSRHNRGCAVDLTLYDLQTGEEVEMPSGYDEFTERAYPDYPGGTDRQRYFRELLRRAMEDQGFAVYEHEWWHFDFEDWREYPIGNERL